jgi:hypothetical protein
MMERSRSAWPRYILSLTADCQRLALRHLRYLAYAFASVRQACFRWIGQGAFSGLSAAPSVQREWAKFVTEIIREFLADPEGGHEFSLALYGKIVEAELHKAAVAGAIDFLAVEPFLQFAVALFRSDLYDFTNVRPCFALLSVLRDIRRPALLRAFFTEAVERYPDAFDGPAVAKFVRGVGGAAGLVAHAELLRIFARSRPEFAAVARETIGLVRTWVAQEPSDAAADVFALFESAVPPE